MNLLVAQKALRALGYDVEASGQYTNATRDAFCAFQRQHGLPMTGTLDLATERKLSSLLGSTTGADAASADSQAGLEMAKRASFFQGVLAGVFGTGIAGGLYWAVKRSLSMAETECTCGECDECMGFELEEGDDEGDEDVMIEEETEIE
jgi:peptidoglycan hydrolase-like protein with peptidoglycan-binding domain